MPHNIKILEIVSIVEHASNIVMSYYQTQSKVHFKQDTSPVTEADLAANDFIVNALRQRFPSIPVVSEESAETHHYAKLPLFWLVDPLDGTKGFIKGKGQFTVNIGLIENGIPIAGVISIPVEETLYYAGMQQPAYRQKKAGLPEEITVRPAPKEGLTIISSHSHRTPETDHYIQSLPKIAAVTSAASSLKFCRIAEGLGDVYPRFGRTMEWDTAAGHAILKAAGGEVYTEDGTPLTYGKPGFENPNFIASILKPCMTTE